MYGYGMNCYVVHESVGGGANLSCTCIYLTLIDMKNAGRPLPEEIHLQLDNTCSENKCTTMFCFAAWLVAKGWCDRVARSAASSNCATVRGQIRCCSAWSRVVKHPLNPGWSTAIDAHSKSCPGSSSIRNSFGCGCWYGCLSVRVALSLSAAMMASSNELRSTVGAPEL